MTESATCLFEIGTEELPAKTLIAFTDALKQQVETSLQQEELPFSTIKSFATPRRLALLISDLALHQPDRNIERRGPAVQAAFDADGNPSKACLGFANSCGVEVNELERLKTDKGEWLVYRSQQPGKTTHELMPVILQNALKRLPIPKPMRWGRGDTQFARPTHWCVLMHGGDVIDTEILGQRSDAVTYGHRFHHPQAITLTSPDDYASALRDAFVIADFDERRDLIRQQIAEITAAENAQCPLDESLLAEVTGLVEWPVALMASFDAAFLDVPAEALIAAMADHQKSFYCERDGKLIAKFITVSNINSKNSAQVIQGNERVMRARLADAAFFYNTDKKQTLASRIAVTENVIFQAKLGTLFAKSKRLAENARFIAAKLNGDIEHAYRAGELSKCDLMTDMVGEFPELQGIMGRYYAQHDGENDTVANALEEYYHPRFSGDSLPASLTGTALALAERFDTLIGIFAIGQKPSGVKDPFKCRRAALAIVRMCIEANLDFEIIDGLQHALHQYADFADKTDVVHEVHDFILDRLRAYYLEQGVHTNVITAVLERQNSHLSDCHQRILAVKDFHALAEAEALAAANKRVSRILTKENVGDQVKPINQDLLREAAELTLAELITQKRQDIEPLFESRQYSELLANLASLREPIDNFFDNVMVNVDDQAVRDNRLALLGQLRHLFCRVADISLL